MNPGVKQSCARSALFVLLSALSVNAQSNLATITGTLTDTTNAIVVSAEVRVTNVATGESQAYLTNESGIYVAPLLKPGKYDLGVERPGFRPYRQAGIILESGARVRVDIRLELGVASQSVEVEATAPLLQSETSSVASVVDNRTIANMPLIDRRAAQLARLSGFVSAGLPTGGSANNSAFAIAGGRGDDNQWFIDGGVAQNSTVDTPGLFFDPPIESLQEFSVSVSNFAAELGRSGGGVIQMTTKSGTNKLHGSAYEYLRNDAFDARTFFSAIKPKLRYDLYGGSVGGPIVRNRTFFFFNYEGRTSKTETTAFANVPSAAEVMGDFSQDSYAVKDPVSNSQFAGNRIPVSRLDSVGSAIAALYPAPNVPGAASQSSNYRSNILTDAPQKSWVLRLDHDLRATDRIYGRFLGLRSNNNVGPLFPTPGIDSNNQLLRTTYYDVSATWSHNFSPSWINEARYDWNQRVADQWEGSTDQGWPAKLGITGTNSRFLPNINVTGLQAMGNGSRQLRYQDPVASNYFNESMTKITGKHTFKWGYEYRASSNTDYFFGTAGGVFSFTNQVTGSGLASLLLGRVASASRQEDLPLKSRADTMGAYVQDDWKVSRTLTLNLGLRWDYDQPRHEVNDNRQNGFDRTAINPVSGTPGVVTFAGRNGVSEYSSQNNWANIGPRLGFAWQPADKWVVRGGAGLLYLGEYTNNVTFDPALGFSLQGSFVSPDSGVTPAFLMKNGMPALSYPTEASLTPGFGAVAVGASPTTSVSFLENNRRNGYLESFSMAVQRQLGKAWVAELGYVGNLGHRLPGANSQSINQVPTALLGAGNAQAKRPFPQFSSVAVLQPDIGNSNYHAMNLKVEKRYSAGLHLQANYTFSKFIDDIASRDELAGYPSSGFTNYYDRKGDRGLSGNDIRQRFVASAVYDLPFGVAKRWNPRSGVVRGIVGGWSLGYISELRSGAPIGVVEQTNNTNSFSAGVRPNVVGDPNLPGGRSRGAEIAKWFDVAAFAAPAAYTFGNAGKTIGYGPGAISMDLSLIRDFHITERHHVEFRGESMNFINRPNFANPSTARGNTNFGRITSLAPGNQSRVIQLGLRYSF